MHTPTDDAALRREQQELLFRQAPVALAGGALVVFLTSLLLWETAAPALLVGWAAASLLTYVFRFVLAMRFRRLAPGLRSDPRWGTWFAIGSGLTGASWGIGTGFLLFPADSLIYQTLLIAILAGLSSSTVASQASHRWSGAALLLAADLPIALRALWEGGTVQTVIGLLVLLFVAAILVAQRHAYRSVVRNLSLAFENKALLADLMVREERMNHAQRIAGFGYWVWDLAGERIEWSDEVFRIFDFEPGQLVNRDIILLAVHPADRHVYEESLRATLTDGVALEVEYRIVRPDGSVRHLREVAEVVLREPNGQASRLEGVTSDISDRVEAESQTKSAWREMNRILENMQDTYFRAEQSGKVTYVSRSISTLLGFRPDEFFFERFSDFCVQPAEWTVLLRALKQGGGAVRNYELQMCRKDGRKVWVAINAQHVLDERGDVAGIEGTARDVSELKQALDALHQETELALVTLQSIGDGVVTTDNSGHIRYLNPVAEQLLGCGSGEAFGCHYLEHLSIEDESTGESLGDLVELCLSGTTGVVHVDEGLFTHRDGTRYHLKVTAAPMRDQGGQMMGSVLVLHDITTVMGMARQLSYQASHDTLTGLFNRQVFEKRVEQAIREAQAGGGPHVVFYMDLDQFKIVNDTCGHQAGDQLLQQVAMIMQRTLRDTDVVARLGGDEFGVLLERCPLEKAVEIAEAVRTGIRDFRFALGDKVFDIGVSIGVVPVDAASANLAEVLSAADAACYVAKDHGRNRIHLYQLEDDAIARRHGEMEWVHRLAAAFDEDRFILYAQPIVHLVGERLVSHYEVLVRMTDRNGALVPPMAFIPAAERYDLMPAVDRWVVRTTLITLREAQGSLAFPPVNCAINLSGQSICDDQFLDFVVDLFDSTGIPPESVCFEITETAAIANLSRATRFIQVLRDMGCSFALDDFGSGLSSFGYLKSLAVDYLKIDGSFVKNVVEDEVDRAMVDSINQIGHVLGLKTIAEFVDGEASVAVLRTLGVDFAQGNGVGHPRPFSTILHGYLVNIGQADANPA